MTGMLQQLTENYQAEGPERCGLILDTGEVIETENIAEDTLEAFEIPAEDMLQYELNLTGTWHTHPGQSANLSHEDYAGFLAWPDLDHHIIGADGLRTYRVGEIGAVYEVEA